MALDVRVSGPLRRAALQFLVSVPLSDAKPPNYFVHSKLLIISILYVKARIEKHKFKRFGKKLAHTL